MPLPFSPGEWTPCQTTDPELFFPEPKGPVATAREAKALCGQCPARVRDACLAYALTSQVEGIWGGTSGKERRKLRQQIRAAA